MDRMLAVGRNVHTRSRSPLCPPGDVRSSPRGYACLLPSPLQTIEAQHLSASTKTNALHKACEQLVQEQTDLVTFNESINERLSHFVELDGLTQKMNAPTVTVLP